MLITSIVGVADDEMVMLLNKLLLLLMISDMSLASRAHKPDCCMQLLSPHHPCAGDELPLLLNKLLVVGAMSMLLATHRPY